MEDIFIELLTAYGLSEECCVIESIGSGHIHDTYLIKRKGLEMPPLVLQRMNTEVFPDVELLMKNLEILTTHIAFKNRKSGLDPAKNGILLLETEEGKSWIGNESSGYWRMFWYIQDQIAHEFAPDTKVAEEGGRAIGDFQKMLLDLDPGLIADTIPNFHDLKTRIKQFKKSYAEGDPGRIRKSEQYIHLAEQNFNRFLTVYEISAREKFPIRLAHNDTKFNNILFSKSGKATCLIDLDTVMKGYSWYDFGDALRTCASTASEEETDPGKIDFRLDIFESFAKGYLAEAHSFLLQGEIKILHRVPELFAFMQGLRFLTDYLNGDVYYKIHEPDQNLKRAINQFQLASRIRDKESEMAGIISIISKKSR